MKVVKQFRYYSNNNANNFPAGLTKQALCTNGTSSDGTGNVLASSTMPIV